ncbi:glycosyltransferase [Longimicrobium sp.]|uniref:glycosyltransferase n=1 Tax=Longimicrobium sp. TaxID=2029185 RepID=UPI003B3B3844
MSVRRARQPEGLQPPPSAPVPAGAAADPARVEVAFVGSVVPTELAWTTRAFSPAGNRFQLGLLEFLSRGAGMDVHPFITLPQAAWPRDPSVLVRGGRVPLEGVAAQARLVPYLNLRGPKEATVAASLFAHLGRWARGWSATAPRALLVYNVFSPLALPVLAVARAWGVPAVAIVADLPFGYRLRGVRGMLERLDVRAQLAVLRRFDGLVVLTPHVAREYAPGVPWIRMEGGIHPADAGEPLASGAGTHGERAVMYSGMLNEMNGIPLLLDAFARLRGPEWRLWIYGGGPLERTVRAAAARDERILFRPWEQVPAEEMRLRQRDAAVLVNPRPSSHRANRYSFPSKLLDYLVSGTPVASTAPPGIPAEYHPHLELALDETPDGLADAIRRAAGHTDAERMARGVRAREFVLGDKTWDRQAVRIGEFVRSVARPRRAG